jgi:acyl-coenzyme A synthetase/AMP-(fatty) acid ligase
VAEAVVVPVPDEEIGQRLRALVVPADGKHVAAEELAQHCAQRIPKYMIPESIDTRPHLPKTSTGKIDRQRLLQECMAAAAGTL